MTTELPVRRAKIRPADRIFSGSTIVSFWFTRPICTTLSDNEPRRPRRIDSTIVVVSEMTDKWGSMRPTFVVPTPREW